MHGHALGVDLGTSNTVAVLRWPDGRTRPLLFDGQPIMPSGVLLDPAGRLHVGRDAERLAQADPVHYEPNPKRRVDEPGVLLGEREIATVDLLAAILSAVAHAAVEAVGYLPPAALTHPAAWGARRRDLLAQAVVRAGWPPVEPTGSTRLVPEPVAAARYFAEVLRRPVPVGSALAVFDFGGGTLDVAVVRNDGLDTTGRTRFSVIGTGGVAELGGLDLDAALVDHLGRVVAGSDPAAWERLRNPSGAAQWRDRRRFWDDVRGAKEMLSRAAVAPVAVPGVEKAVHLTRDELERLATPLLRRGVLETAAVIEAARLRPDQLAGLFLVGGSSRVPLVARMLHADLGLAPTVLEQPELPVAEGALAEIAAASVAPHDATAPASSTATIPAQMAPAAVPVPVPTSGGPASAIPVSGVPLSGSPVSESPISGAPVGSVSAPPVSPAAAPAGPPPRGVPPHDPRPSPRRRPWWIAASAAAVVVVVVAVASVVVFLNRERYDGVEFAAFSDVGQPLSTGDERPYYAWTQVVGDRAYFAYQTEDKKLKVIAVDAGSGAEVWATEVPEPNDSWAGIRALPDAVLAYSDPIGSSEPRVMSVLSTDDGSRMWTLKVQDNDDTFSFDDRIVVVDKTNNKIIGYGLTDGKPKWEAASPKNEYDDATTTVLSVPTRDDLDGPADENGLPIDPDRGDDFRLVQIGADRSARVIDVRTGEVVASRPNVADPRDLAAAGDGQLFVTDTSEGTQVFAVDLESMGEPRSIYRATDNQRRAIALQPCGDGRICVLEQANVDAKTTEFVSVDLSGKTEPWRKPAPDARTIVAVGSHVLVQTDRSPETLAVYDKSGATVLEREGVGVRVNGGSMLVFGKALSGSLGDANVVGVRFGADEPVQLGALTGVKTDTCSWNTTVIACAGDQDFRIRKFTR